MPNSSVNQALGAQWTGGGFLLFSQEERKSGVNPALASNLKIEEKSLARVDVCGLGLTAGRRGHDNQVFCRKDW